MHEEIFRPFNDDPKSILGNVLAQNKIIFAHKPMVLLRFSLVLNFLVWFIEGNKVKFSVWLNL